MSLWNADQPVMVMTLEDADTILWADANGDSDLSGTVEWDMLVDKAKKVKALQLLEVEQYEADATPELIEAARNRRFSA